MISNEEKLLVNILYRLESKALYDVDLININFEKLIKIASSHLMLPAFFFNIKKKNLNHLFPDDFIKYLQNIYSINKARNEVLINEVKELSLLLYKNKINHIFLKGSALLLDNIFEDIGVRMIGDVDFIIQKRDLNKIKIVLKDNNYNTKSIDKYKFFKSKHLPKFINKNKIFAIEPHTELLTFGSRYIFNSKLYYEEFNHEINICNTPKPDLILLHCIYNFQIGDHGFTSSSYSHRSIYDTYKILNKYPDLINKIKIDRFIASFFMKIKDLNIPFFDLDHKFKFYPSFFYNIFKLYHRLKSKVYLRFVQSIEFLFNNKYRNYALPKIFNYFTNNNYYKNDKH